MRNIQNVKVMSRESPWESHVLNKSRKLKCCFGCPYCTAIWKYCTPSKIQVFQQLYRTINLLVSFSSWRSNRFLVTYDCHNLHIIVIQLHEGTVHFSVLRFYNIFLHFRQNKFYFLWVAVLLLDFCNSIELNKLPIYSKAEQ